MGIAATISSPDKECDYGNLSPRYENVSYIEQKPPSVGRASTILYFYSILTQDVAEMSQEIIKVRIGEALHKYLASDEALSEIASNYDLIPALYNLQLDLITYFDGARFSLDLFRDYEEDSKVLNVLITGDYSIEEMMELEGRFFTEVFESIYSKFEGRVSFSIEPA